MNNLFKYAIGGVLIFLAVWWIGSALHKNPPVDQSQAEATQAEDATKTKVNESTVSFPLTKAAERVTKKSFGTYVTPENSPVSPEKFKGYHTGLDFEIFPEEADADVPVYAICDGRLLQKRNSSGYGGVLIQACRMDYQDVTVVYGHLDLNSINKNLKDDIKQGEQIAFLGQPPSETDGERKHLHLGIHRGNTIDIRGYVSTKAALSAWLDPMRFIK